MNVKNQPTDTSRVNNTSQTINTTNQVSLLSSAVFDRMDGEMDGVCAFVVDFGRIAHDREKKIRCAVMFTTRCAGEGSCHHPSVRIGSNKINSNSKILGSGVVLKSASIQTNQTRILIMYESDSIYRFDYLVCE